MEITLKNSFGNIYLNISTDYQNGWIYNEWIGSLTLDNVTEGATHVLKVMEETHLTLILNDNTQVTGSWNTANDWIENIWAPHAINLGLKRFAHVLSESMFVAAAAEEMHNRLKGKFDFELFKDIEEAKQWLKEV